MKMFYSIDFLQTSTTDSTLEVKKKKLAVTDFVSEIKRVEN